jgi:hypothetical protein
MTNLRTAAQQALEALEYGQHTLKQVSENQWESRGELAMHALRAALAEPVQEGCDHCNQPLYAAVKCRVCGRVTQAEPVHEPVASLMTNVQSGDVEVVWNDDGFDREMWHETPLYPAPPQRKPKPVALDWLHKWANQDDGEPETQWHEGYEAARRVVQIHLTAPPQRKPLTEEEIQQCFKEAGITIKGQHWTNAVRNVERAHGIT